MVEKVMSLWLQSHIKLKSLFLKPHIVKLYIDKDGLHNCVFLLFLFIVVIMINPFQHATKSQQMTEKTKANFRKSL